MVEEKLILIFKKHDIWVEIVMTFGCTKIVAEDITQEMYIKIQLKLEKGLDIMYNDEINYYYIFKTLKTLFLDLKRKGKNITIISIDGSVPYLREKIFAQQIQEIDINFEGSFETINNELSQMHWYDRKVFEIINGGESIADFSRQSNIKYYALYFTYKKVKEKLKKLL